MPRLALAVRDGHFWRGFRQESGCNLQSSPRWSWFWGPNAPGPPWSSDRSALVFAAPGERGCPGTGGQIKAQSAVEEGCNKDVGTGQHASRRPPPANGTTSGNTRSKRGGNLGGQSWPLSSEGLARARTTQGVPDWVQTSARRGPGSLEGTTKAANESLGCLGIGIVPPVRDFCETVHTSWSPPKPLPKSPNASASGVPPGNVFGTPHGEPSPGLAEFPRVGPV